MIPITWTNAGKKRILDYTCCKCLPKLCLSTAIWRAVRRQMGHGESFACHDAFVAWVNDTYKVGIEGGVYKGITRLQELPAEYVKWAKDIAEQQLALGGYRLADFLRLAAAQGGGLAARPGPAS
ncbi:unnamed protein product, partial [Effrenium voratum]